VTTGGAAGTIGNGGTAGTVTTGGAPSTISNGGTAGTVTTGGAAGTIGNGGTAGTVTTGGAPSTISNGGTAGAATTGGAAGTIGNGGTAGTVAIGGAAGTIGNGGTAGTVTTGGAAGTISNGGTSATGGALGVGGSGGSSFGGATSLGDCHSGTTAGHDYLFCGTTVTWTQARNNCVSVGMQLARVDDLAENQWLGASAYNPSGSAEGIWLGASDAAVEGEWRWSDGTLFWLGDAGGTAQGGLFAGWYVNQPVDKHAADDCAVLDLGVGSTFGWYNQDCSGGLAVYVCESL
jgi:hypothetical protein